MTVKSIEAHVLWVVANPHALLVNLDPVAIKNVGRTLDRKDLLQRRFAIEDIGRIQETDVTAPGMADGLVPGLLDATIVLTAPKREVLLMGLYQLFASIGAATINDNPFKVLPRLRQHGSNRLCQTCHIIIIDGYDGKSHSQSSTV